MEFYFWLLLLFMGTGTLIYTLTVLSQKLTPNYEIGIEKSYDQISDGEILKLLHRKRKMTLSLFVKITGLDENDAIQRLRYLVFKGVLKEIKTLRGDNRFKLRAAFVNKL